LTVQCMLKDKSAICSPTARARNRGSQSGVGASARIPAADSSSRIQSRNGGAEMQRRREAEGATYMPGLIYKSHGSGAPAATPAPDDIVERIRRAVQAESERSYRLLFELVTELHARIGRDGERGIEKLDKAIAEMRGLYRYAVQQPVDLPRWP